MEDRALTLSLSLSVLSNSVTVPAWGVCQSHFHHHVPLLIIMSSASQAWPSPTVLSQWGMDMDRDGAFLLLKGGGGGGSADCTIKNVNCCSGSSHILTEDSQKVVMGRRSHDDAMKPSIDWS